MTWKTTILAPFDETQEHGSEAEAESWAAEFHARTGESVAIWDDEQGGNADSEPHGVPETGQRGQVGTDTCTTGLTPQNGAERIFVSRVVSTEGEA